MTSSDDTGAFSTGDQARVEGSGQGPLSGTQFAAKDNFDVAGFVTGGGNPDWARAQRPAERTASVITRLLGAGASLAGKTQMDELAWGTLGINRHYGTPLNSAAPDRVPGGSSSGSASAVAAGLVDFALGTDTACSVRLPASFCGLYGFRPTPGAVPLDGVLPLSHSLDTVGWFARDAALLAQVGEVLLEPAAPQSELTTLLVAEDAFRLTQPAIAQALRPVVDRIAGRFARRLDVRTVDPGPERGLEWLWYRAWAVEVREAWDNYGGWIESQQPNSQVLTRANFAAAADSTAEETEAAYSHFSELRSAISGLVQEGSVLCIPTAACLPPRLDEPDPRSGLRPTLCLMSVAGLGGLPQVTIPAARVDGVPAGLSFIGPEGSDAVLLRIARELAWEIA